MSRKYQLGDLQLAIMKVLWAQGRASASSVHRALWEERGLAPTTIATMLRKMEEKGVVSHRLDGRKFIYEPEITEDGVRRSMVEQVAQRLFRGDVAAFASYLISEGEIDSDELSELEKLVAEKGRKGREHRS
ncbi:MAG: BlaI/MecI/CopY family transcriptional regulator [bacterium]|nr:BlaI/MecI/CopY family transcriptional regulator [bacterium]